MDFFLGNKVYPIPSIILLISVIALLVLLIILHFGGLEILVSQRAYYQALEKELGQLQQEVAQLKAKKNAEIIASTQLHFLLNLYNKNVRAVHFLNQLTYVMPTNVSLTQLILQDPYLLLEGEATSDEDITALMQNLAQSPIFFIPILKKISSNSANERYFQLEVTEQES